MKYLGLIWTIARRECKILYVNRIYFFSMVVFPVLALVFFTSLMDEGLPEDMPVGVVDLDNTSTSRGLIRRLDAFQSSTPSSISRREQPTICCRAVARRSPIIIIWVR